MAMTRTRVRKQATLTFLAEQLAAVERELATLQTRQQDLETRRAALREAIAQFDPEIFGSPFVEKDQSL